MTRRDNESVYTRNHTPKLNIEVSFGDRHSIFLGGIWALVRPRSG